MATATSKGPTRIERLKGWGLACVLTGLTSAFAGAAPPRWPGLEEARRYRALDLQGPGFAPMTKKDILEALEVSTRRACLETLVEAQFYEALKDAISLDPTTRFINCRFEETLDNLKEALAAVEKAAKAEDLDDALQSLGRALSIQQAVFARTDYVERAAERFSGVAEVPLLRLWSKDGRKSLLDDARKGKVVAETRLDLGDSSCSEPPLVDAVDKSSPTAPGAEREIEEWEGQLAYSAAVQLAIKESEAFLAYAVERWPILRARCPFVAYRTPGTGTAP